MTKVNQTCTKCKLNKPIGCFYFIKRSQSHDTRCKRCVSAYVRERNQADGGQAMREIYQRRKERGYTQKKWSEKTEHEKRLIYEGVKRYREKNKGKVNEENRQSLQLRRSLAYQKAWPVILVHYGNRCLRCGSDKKICFDHVDPIGLGGHNLLSNGQPLCLGCNTSKGATDRIRDYRPDFGAWIVELVRLNPWLGEPLPRGRWHLTPEGRSRSERLWLEWDKSLAVPGQIAHVGSGFQPHVSETAEQIAQREILAQLRASLSDAH